MKSLINNGTWILNGLPEGYKLIGSKYVFKWKLLKNGYIDKFKARSVLKDFIQKEDLNFFFFVRRF